MIPDEHGRSPRRLVILIDGGSGAGKTTFAHALRLAVEEVRGRPVQLMSLDDCYPGWDGLAEGSRMVIDDILRPDNPGWWGWDWDADATTDWHPLDPDDDLIVEGCGTITHESAPLASFTAWLELDADARRHRAIARDGDRYAPFWDRWAAQEAEHWARNDPRELADFVVDLNPEVAPASD
ncbi:MAG TPA: cobalt ABC transporter [Propionibacteriaceae bacterium]|nr:cobalt ABC transporter [Propionibacteriaceae bacterium]